MTKQDLAQEIADKKGLTKKQALDAIDGFSEALISAMAFGQSVFLRGFGTFKVQQRKGKMARDITRGTIIEVPARKVVKFVPSKQLKDVVK
ncbi:MAG: integration host factor subunit beta [Bacteroidales bacterium]|nr:integration host factor subunit beta [Bacteroidales bacterium]